MEDFKFDWSMYTGGLDWIPKNTIYVTVHGSRAYNTSTPTSDWDLRGIAIAKKQHYLGYLTSFEETHQTDPDFVIFELQKFFKLAADANPNALELLYTDPSCHLFVSPIGQKLIDARDQFLSQKAIYTLGNYAKSQLRRMELHRSYLRKPIEVPPKRSDFGLPERTVIPHDQLVAVEAAIQKKLDQWNWHQLDGVDPSVRHAIKEEFHSMMVELTQWELADIEGKKWDAAVKTLGIDSNFIQLLDKERQYTARKREYDQFQTWKKTRNPARAEMEAKFSFDGKHALHLIRLFLQCKYLLRDGVLTVKSPDASLLLDIRNGKYTYEQIMDMANGLIADIDALAKTTSLVKEPNRNKLDNLCVELIEEFFSSQ